MLQIKDGQIGGFELLMEVHQLLDKGRILAQATIDLQIAVRKLGEDTEKNHGKASIIHGLLILPPIEHKIPGHLGKTGHRYPKGGLVGQEFQDLALLLKGEGIGRDIEDSLTSLRIGLGLLC